MLIFIKEIRNKYPEPRLYPDKYIKEIWNGILAQRSSAVPQKAIKIFIKLRGQSDIVEGKAIFAEARFPKYNNQSSHGLWHWLPENGDVITITESSDGEKCYQVDELYYKAMVKVIRIE